MTPLRAAVLLALEQECRHQYSKVDPMPQYGDQVYVLWRGAKVAAISSRIEYPGLVRSSAIRAILNEERAAGRVLRDDGPIAYNWWPVGLCATLAAEREQAQREWHAQVLRSTEAIRVCRALSQDAAERLAIEEVTRDRGPCP